MTGVLAPQGVPEVDVVPGDAAGKAVVVILAEDEHRVTGLFELNHKVGLFGSVREVTHGTQEFVTSVGPVEDAWEFRCEFADDVDIPLSLFRICRIWCFDVLAREVHELHTAVQAVDDVSGGHSVTGVDELAPGYEVDVIQTLVTGLDGCTVCDFQEPLTDFATGEVRVNIRADVQQGVLEPDALEFLCQAGRFHVGDVGIAEEFLNYFQVDGFAVATAADEQEYFLVDAVREQDIASDELEYFLPDWIVVGNVLDERFPHRTLS